jgi:hypothetical protein
VTVSVFELARRAHKTIALDVNWIGENKEGLSESKIVSVKNYTSLQAYVFQFAHK